jgi:hypothetical protein
VLFRGGVVKFQEQALKEYPNNAWKQREFLVAKPFQIGVGLFTKKFG